MSEDEPVLIKGLNDSHAWLQEHNVQIDDRVVSTLPDINNIMDVAGRPVVCFCSSGYLGVQARPEIKGAAAQAIYQYGIDTTMSRFVGGNLDVLVDLEKQLADFKGEEASVTFATGLMANLGAIPAIIDTERYMKQFYGFPPNPRDRLILGDQLNHYSIRMGIRVAHATYKRYPHNDMAALEQLLDQNRSTPTLVVTDSVFSLDGDLVSLPKVIELCKNYGATLYIDDAHGTGVLGRNGRGTAEHFGVEGQVDIQMGTLSKAFGIIGGFVAGEKSIIDMIKFSAPTYIFTSSLTAVEAVAVMTAIDIVKKEPMLRETLWKNVYHTMDGLRAIGVGFPLQWSPIIPIMIRDEQKAIDIEAFMLDRGVYCSAVRPPGVTANESRLRLLVNANHNTDQLDHLLEVLDDVAHTFGLPKEYLSPDVWNEFLLQTPDYITEFIHAPN